EVGDGEVEVLLAFLGDGHPGGGQVAAAGVQGRAALDGGEVDVHDALGHAELLRHQVDDVHVEADDLVALVELEGLVRDVRAGGELAAVDQLHSAGGAGLGLRRFL